MPLCLRLVVIGALALLAPITFASPRSPTTHGLAHKKRVEAAVDPSATELNPTVETQGDGVDTSVTSPTSTYVIDDATGNDPIDPLTKEDSKLFFEFVDLIEREKVLDTIDEFGFYDEDYDVEDLEDLDDSAPTRFKRQKKAVVKWTLEERAENVRGQHEAIIAQMKVIQAQVDSVLSADGLLGVTVGFRKLFKLVLRSVIVCLYHTNHDTQTDGDSTRLALILYELAQNYATLVKSLEKSNARTLSSKPFASAILMSNFALELYFTGTRLGLSQGEQDFSGRYTYGSAMFTMFRGAVPRSLRTLGRTDEFACYASEVDSDVSFNWSTCFRKAQEAERKAYAAAQAAEIKASTPN